jgi:hypothetical protein
MCVGELRRTHWCVRHMRGPAGVLQSPPCTRPGSAYGNAVWTQAGAMTIAYQGVADEMKRYEPARWQASEKERKDVAGMKQSGPQPPQQTFTARRT